MSDLIREFQRRHQEYLAQLEHGEVTSSFLDEVRILLTELREAGQDTADPAERAHLRALLHFWASVLYEHTGSYPRVALLPPAELPSQPNKETFRQPAPRLLWLLVGGACAVVMLLGSLVVSGIAAGIGRRVATVPTPSVNVPLVRYATLSTGMSGSHVLTQPLSSFCLHTPEIVATFALQNLEPTASLRWELLKDGQVFSTDTAIPWGQDLKFVTVRTRGQNDQGVEPGQYELHLYADEQLVSRHTFEVLDVPPQISHLRVADVPQPSASLESSAVFSSPLRVVYLDYDYAGFCTGMRITYTLYRDGAPVLKTTEQWEGTANGHQQAVFQASGNLQFVPGTYELMVSTEGNELGRSHFVVQGEAVEESEEKPALPPAFGNIVVALGVYPNGTPILPAQDVTFDWNTKVVYAIFPYRGMEPGMPWTVVWTRNGEEIARRTELWSAEAGTQGTYWVTYYDLQGRAIRGGNYSVALWIGDTLQSSAEFTVLYYAPTQ